MDTYILSLAIWRTHSYSMELGTKGKYETKGDFIYAKVVVGGEE